MKYFLNFNIKKKLVKSVFSLFAITILSLNIANAQYCASAATYPADEDIYNVKLETTGKVLLNNNSYMPPNQNCAQYTDYTSSIPAIPMSAGGNYTLTINVGYCGTVLYTNMAFAWIDYNRNNTFESSEGVRATPFGGSTGARDIIYNFTVPCNINPGKTRMRVICIEGTITNPTSACATYGWGETEDYSIDLQLPTSLSANFVAPSKVWVKTKANFINSNQTGYISHTWDANNDGTIDALNSINYTHTWTTSGTKCMKLKSTNCLGSDSIVKCLSVESPVAKPAADFVASSTTIEQYSTVKLYDLSTNGPYMWVWNVYDSVTYATESYYPTLANSSVLSNPNNNGSTEYSQNPEFYFSEPGCYAIELVSTNDVGSSALRRKVCYITVTLPTIYYLGLGTYGPNLDNVVGSAGGTIFDNGGANLNYGNGMGYGTRSYLQITPCNAKKITLKMTRLKFNSTADVLRVWDGKSASGTLLASWTAGSKAPASVTATSGSMFILFESDGTGVDSGFAGTYTSELGPAQLTPPSFAANTVPSYNGAPTRFTNTTANIIGVPYWEWTIDGSPVANNKKKDLDYIFYTDGPYEVCLEMKSCVGNSKVCDTVNVITPNSQTTLDFTASNRRPAINTDIVSLIPVSDNANRYEWTISPTTYTLLNPPQLPSKYGAGFIKYNALPGDSIPRPSIKFTGSGCYTIALKAYNDNDTNATIRTVVKNKYVCALDYCVPASFILSSDIGINAVTVVDGSTTLINNLSTSGVSGYSNYSTTQIAEMTYGRQYKVTVARNTNLDSANRKGWIDWNIDGDFDDAGEQIFFEPIGLDKIYTASFTVPALSESFEGMTIMRLAANYGSENITPCGPITAGEYEDYGIRLVNDNTPPVITLLGNQTERMEVNSTYTDAGATAWDASEGDITSSIVTASDLDVNTIGIYTISYNVTDKSGNQAVGVKRTIIVEKDLTPPVLILNPDAPGCKEASRTADPYVDPGATAYNTNPFVDLTSSIVVKGAVDMHTIGTYVLDYSVKDAAGNRVSKSRTVCVADSKPPVILNNGDTAIQIGSTWLDQTTVFDAYDDDPSLIKEWLNLPVNANKRNTYTVTYRSTDQSGNPATPVTVNYRVDDFIAPVINLNTFDVIEIDVNVPYKSINATVSDNYYTKPGEVSISKIYDDVDYTLLGTYTEVFRAVDGSGNVTEKTRTVHVVDREAPILWGETIYGCVGQNIWPMWGITTTDNYYSPQTLKPMVEIIHQNVNPMQAGIYAITYRVTDPSGNKSLPYTTTVIYTYWPNCTNSTLDIKDVKGADESVSLYPNPSTGLVTLDMNGALAQNAELEVYNAMGQKVLSRSYAEATGQFELDLSGNAKGVYTIRILSDGQTVVKRVVIQ